MKTQMTLNKFNSLSLKEKFAQFGENMFSTKAYNLIEYLIEEIQVSSESLSIDLGVSKRSLGATAGRFKSLEIIDIQETWYDEKLYTLDLEALEEIFFNLEDLIDEDYIVIIEETPAQETQETPAQKPAQISLNQFNALTLLERLEMFGDKFFTYKQCTILKSMLEFNYKHIDSEDIANDTDLSKRSVASIVNSLNRKHPEFTKHWGEYNHYYDLVCIDRGMWTNETLYTLDQDHLELIICLDELIEMGAVDFIEETSAQEIEETPAQEIEETPAQKPAVKLPRKLKASTIKAYSNDQLINHLDRLQNYLEDPAFRIDTIIRYYNASDRSYWPYCSKHERHAILIAIDETYYKLGLLCSH